MKIISQGSIIIDAYYLDGMPVKLSVDCRIEKDFKTNMIRKIRLDTDETVEERMMTEEEKNESI